MAVIDAAQIAEMSGWVAACLECEPGALSPSEILNYTEHNYPGGIRAYLHGGDGTCRPAARSGTAHTGRSCVRTTKPDPNRIHGR